MAVLSGEQESPFAVSTGVVLEDEETYDKYWLTYCYTPGEGRQILYKMAAFEVEATKVPLASTTLGIEYVE